MKLPVVVWLISLLVLTGCKDIYNKISPNPEDHFLTSDEIIMKYTILQTESEVVIKGRLFRSNPNHRAQIESYLIMDLEKSSNLNNIKITSSYQDHETLEAVSTDYPERIFFPLSNNSPDFFEDGKGLTYEITIHKGPEYSLKLNTWKIVLWDYGRRDGDIMKDAAVKTLKLLITSP